MKDSSDHHFTQAEIPIPRRARVLESRRLRLFRVYLHRLLPKHQDSSNTAISVFIGVFIGIMPTVGVALPLTIAVCWLFRKPKIPAVIASFIANPFTQFGFFYPLSYAFGRFLMKPAQISFDFLEQLQNLSFNNFSDIVGQLLREGGEHLLAFMVGVTLVSLIFGILFSVAAYFGAEYRKKHHWKKREMKLSQTLRES